MLRLPVALLVTGYLALAAKADPAGLRVTLQPGPPAQVLVEAPTGGVFRAIVPPLSLPYPGKMASLGDIDQDGAPDLLLLVYKTTRFDPKPAWRPFVFTLREGNWRPKWLGSRVGRPLREAVLVQTPNGPRLLTLETFASGQCGLTLYHWRGFGFWGEWTGPPLGEVSGLEVKDNNKDGVDEISLQGPRGRREFKYADTGYRPI